MHRTEVCSVVFECLSLLLSNIGQAGFHLNGDYLLMVQHAAILEQSREEVDSIPAAAHSGHAPNEGRMSRVTTRALDTATTLNLEIM